MSKFLIAIAAVAVFATGVYFMIDRMPDDDGPPAAYSAEDTVQEQEDAISIPEREAIAEAPPSEPSQMETTEETGPVTVETVEETVEASGVASPAEGATDDPINDEAALDADTIGVAEASDPGFIANALSPENFEAERAVALIENSPDLSAEEKVSLMRSVQAVAEDPAALEEVLAELRALLLSDG
jgi:hypothetical protein